MLEFAWKIYKLPRRTSVSWQGLYLSNLYHPAAPTCGDRSLDPGTLTHSLTVYRENLKKENGESSYSVYNSPCDGN